MPIKELAGILSNIQITSATCWLGDDSGLEPLDYIPNSQVKRKTRQWYLVVMTSESRLSPSLQVALEMFFISALLFPPLFLVSTYFFGFLCQNKIIINLLKFKNLPCKIIKFCNENNYLSFLLAIIICLLVGYLSNYDAHSNF